jgi:hypothetical protein
VTETTTSETPPEQAAEVVAESEPKTEAQVGAPVWVWVVYVLGSIAAAVFAGSLLSK